MIKYKITPRGIIKWHPFAAINNPEADAFEMNRINNIAVMPELSTDQIEEYNRDLLCALEEASDVFLSWFDGEGFQTISGKIEKVDVLEGTVKIAGRTIALATIVEMM